MIEPLTESQQPGQKRGVGNSTVGRVLNRRARNAESPLETRGTRVLAPFRKLVAEQCSSTTRLEKRLYLMAT